MRRIHKILGLLAALFAALLAWGYWHAATHATLNIRVEDVGLRSKNLLYDSPHNVRLELYDSRGALLARAHSVEPAGYIQAIHPDAAIADCRQYEGSQAREAYSDCFRQHSSWAATWLGSVRTAGVAVAGCALSKVAVEVDEYNSEWWYWWVPLPHVGGTPYRYGSLRIRIDSRACTAVRIDAGQ